MKDIYKIILFLCFFCLLLIPLIIYIYIDIENTKIYNTNLKISVGMDLNDIQTILGKPDKIYTNKDYLLAMKMEKEYPSSYPKLPITNKVFLYKRKARPNWMANYNLYVFFNNDEKVEKIFWGDSDVRPSWGE